MSILVVLNGEILPFILCQISHQPPACLPSLFLSLPVKVSDPMPIRIDVPQRVVIAILVLIQRLRLSKLCVGKGLLLRIPTPEHKQLSGPPAELVRTSKPSPHRRVVSRKKVIQPGFVISLLLSELLPHLVAQRVALSRGATTSTRK